MILRIAHFLSILVLSLSLRCNDVGSFFCGGQKVTNETLTECKKNDHHIVCMYHFDYRGPSMAFTKAKPTVIANETSGQCARVNSELLVYCTTNNCDIDFLDAARTCHNETMICGNKLLWKEKVPKEKCFILIKVPDKSSDKSTKLNQWTRDYIVSPLTNKENHCYADVGFGLKRYCDENDCDTIDGIRQIKPLKMHLRECFSDQTIACAGEEYIVAMKNLRRLEDAQSKIKAACAIEIRIENGTKFHKKSYFTESPDPDSCNAINIASQSITVLCNKDNCDDKLSVTDLVAKCTHKVELFLCGDKHYLFNRTNPSAPIRYCQHKFTFKAGGESSSEFIYGTFKERIDPLCTHDDKEHHSFYCQDKCHNGTLWDGINKCTMEQAERDLSAQNSRTRLLLSIFLPIVTLLVVVPIVAGGFCALCKARAAYLYEEEKYLTEFGVPFDEGMEEVEEVTKKTKKSGGTTATGVTGKTTKTGKSTPTGKTTTRKKGGKTGNTTTTVKSRKTTTTVKSGRTGNTTTTVKTGTTTRVQTTSKAIDQSKQSTPS